MPEPLANGPQSGADILVQCLINHGVDSIFAYPGGASMPLHQALTRVSDRLRTILPRHEQGGAFAAQGYTRSTGKVSVCMSTSGPGATNFVTSLADAKMDSIPIIAITGQVSTPVIGTDAFQETPIVEVCRAVTKHHYLVTRTEDIPRVMKEAFHLAVTGRPGPILIDVPKDVQTRVITPDYDPPMNLPGYKPDRRATRWELDQVLQMMKASSKPIIYAGGKVTVETATEMVVGEAPSFVEEESVVEDAHASLTRLEKWKRKLLDLSLRNKLLNFKAGKGAVRLVCPDPGMLEDKLAAGEKLRLQPKAKVMEGGDPRSAFGFVCRSTGCLIGSALFGHCRGLARRILCRPTRDLSQCHGH